MADPIAAAERTEAFRARYFKNNRIDERSSYNIYRLEQENSDPGIKGIPYIFVTTPFLNLSTENIQQSDFFTGLNETDPDLLRMMSYKYSGNAFIPILSNRMAEFTTADLIMDTKEMHETDYGYHQTLPMYAPTADSTSITYIDNSNLDVLKVHKVWFDYIEKVTRGIMRPELEAIADKYLDYTSSIYRFTVDMDGETIQYFDKLTGCYPTELPYGDFSSSVAGNQELLQYGIEYAYSYREYLNPSILMDFNQVGGGIGGSPATSEAAYRTANDQTTLTTVTEPAVDDDLASMTRPRIYQKNGKYILSFTDRT